MKNVGRKTQEENKGLIPMKAIDAKKLVEEIEKELNNKVAKVTTKLEILFKNKFADFAKKQNLMKQISWFDLTTFGIALTNAIVTAYILLK